MVTANRNPRTVLSTLPNASLTGSENGVEMMDIGHDAGQKSPPQKDRVDAEDTDGGQNAQPQEDGMDTKEDGEQNAEEDDGEEDDDAGEEDDDASEEDDDAGEEDDDAGEEDDDAGQNPQPQGDSIDAQDEAEEDTHVIRNAQDSNSRTQRDSSKRHRGKALRPRSQAPNPKNAPRQAKPGEKAHGYQRKGKEREEIVQKVDAVQEITPLSFNDLDLTLFKPCLVNRFTVLSVVAVDHFSDLEGDKEVSIIVLDKSYPS